MKGSEIGSYRALRMSDLAELNVVLKAGHIGRLNLSSDHRQEVLTFLGPEERPLNACHIRAVELPDASYKGNNLFALVTDQRLVFILLVNDSLTRVGVQFNALPLSNVERVSEIEGLCFVLHLFGGGEGRVTGFHPKSRFGQLHATLVQSVGRS